MYLDKKYSGIVLALDSNNREQHVPRGESKEAALNKGTAPLLVYTGQKVKVRNLILSLVWTSNVLHRVSRLFLLLLMFDWLLFCAAEG